MSLSTLLFADTAEQAGALADWVRPLAGAAAPVLAAVPAPGVPAPFAEDLCPPLADLARRQAPDLILVAATPLGRELAPRLAVRLGTGCVSDCVHIGRGEAGEVLADRPVFGGVAIATVAFRTAPAVCLVAPGVTGPNRGESSVVVTALTPEAGGPGRGKRVVQQREVERGVDLSAADRIVAVGRGMARREDLEQIRELAAALAAEVACSRPLAEDLGWLGAERQVGLTGTTVRPALYLAVGISGQVQHVTGMKDSRVVVAINNNRAAPIFQVADYGIVGDLYEAVPALLAALRLSES